MSEQASVPQDLLLAFMRGELDEAAQAALVHRLRREPALRQELRWLQLAASESFAQVEKATQQAAFERLQQRIDAGQPRVAQPGYWQRLRLWLQPHGGMLQGTLAAMVLVQAIALGGLWWQHEKAVPTASYRGGGEDCLSVIVRFSPDARGTEITRWLTQYGASIVAGPDADGRYRLRLADSQAVGDFMYAPEARILTDAMSQPAGCVAGK